MVEKEGHICEEDTTVGVPSTIKDIVKERGGREEKRRDRDLDRQAALLK